MSGSDLVNPDFAALARADGWRSEFVDRTADFEPALQCSIEAGMPTLVRVKLDADVSAGRSTLTGMRNAATGRE